MNSGEASKRPYRMGARQQAVEATRERICSATIDLWLTGTYEDLTLDAVAERAGVTRQTVIRHYGSKEGLVVAAAGWYAPRLDAQREVEPGDVPGAVARVVEQFERMGDANIRMLELEGRVDAIDELLGVGRASHRAWIEHTFGPFLVGLAEPDVRRVVDALYAATDVTVWKLLRRDFHRSEAAVAQVVETLVDGILTTIGDASS